jgi:mannosyltransferase
VDGARRARLRSLLPVAALTVLAAALRFSTLGDQSYWNDEAVTVGLLRRGFFDMLSALPSSESTPPLYYVVAWVWAKVFGTGEVGLRALSALCGTAMTPVAYAVGAALATRRVGLIAAAFVATSPLLVWYSQEARAYALYALLGALSLLFFVRALREPSRRALIGWVVASSLALATHYFAVFAVFAEAVVLLTLTTRRRAVAAAASAIALAGVALLPLAAYQEHGGRTSWIADTPVSERARDVARRFVGGMYPVPHAAPLALLLAAVAAALLALRARRDERTAAFVSLSVGAAALALPLVLALGGLDYFLDRNLLIAWLPLALVVAIALGTARTKWLGAAAATALTAAAFGVVVASARRDDIARDDWRSVRDMLGRSGQKLVLVSPAFERRPLEYYRPELRPLGPREVRVSEIVVLGYPDEGMPFPPDGFRTPARFELVESRLLDRVQVRRFRAPRAVAVGAAQVGLAGRGPSVLLLVDRGGDR